MIVEDTVFIITYVMYNKLNVNIKSTNFSTIKISTNFKLVHISSTQYFITVIKRYNHRRAHSVVLPAAFFFNKCISDIRYQISIYYNKLLLYLHINCTL